MKKIFLLSMAIILLFGAKSVVFSDSYVVTSSDGGQEIIGENQDEKAQPLALTKIFTSYVALKNLDNDKEITVTAEMLQCVGKFEPTIKLQEGEIMSTYDLVNGVLLGSGNDAVCALALSVCKSEGEFVELMNKEAKAIGCTKTVFTNATGNRDENQYTTANDMAKMLGAAYSNKELAGILNTVHITIPETNKSGKRYYRTSNHLISSYVYPQYFYYYALGGRVSMVDEETSVAIKSAKSGQELICVVMNVKNDGPRYTALYEARDLLEKVYRQYKTTAVVKQGEIVYESEIRGTRKENLLLMYPEKSINAVIPRSDAAPKYEKNVVIMEKLIAPIEKGQVVGTISYTYNGKVVGVSNLLAADYIPFNILSWGYSILSDFLKQPAVKGVFVLLGTLIVGYIFVVLIAANKEKNRKKRGGRNR